VNPSNNKGPAPWYFLLILLTLAACVMLAWL
jgi:hypothetical protein